MNKKTTKITLAGLLCANASMMQATTQPDVRCPSGVVGVLLQTAVLVAVSAYPERMQALEATIREQVPNPVDTIFQAFERPPLQHNRSGRQKHAHMRQFQQISTNRNFDRKFEKAKNRRCNHRPDRNGQIEKCARS